MHPQANVVPRRRIESSPTFWALVAITGVGAGLAGGLLMRLFHALQHLAWSYETGGFVAAVAAASPLRRIVVVLLAGVLVTAGLLILRARKGGHALELTVSIWFRAGESPPLKTLARSVLSIAIVALGAALGREGALKQTGAVIAHLLASARRLSPPERRLLTACGAGAGLAAAYNLPVGGALFAIEVLLGTLTLPVALPALAASILGAAASWLLLPAQPTYDTPAYRLSLPQLGWAVGMGLVAGAAALAYTRLIAWATRGRPRGGAG
ncbi:MAG: chloride channel protein, partial [Alphaproteobacteria bacterium]|nr:chloride channel protein [Alphaproteobacteria bacterium]